MAYSGLLEAAVVGFIAHYCALATSSGRTFAVKVIAVGDDFGDIIKEIKVMRQCHSPYIVKYYGKVFHEEELWVRCDARRCTSASSRGAARACARANVL